MAYEHPEIDRLNRWRHFGDGPATYTAGSKQFGDDVIVALIEIERLRALVEGCAAIAENPGFIQAHDTEWDEGVNYAKRFIAKAIRAALERKP